MIDKSSIEKFNKFSKKLSNIAQKYLAYCGMADYFLSLLLLLSMCGLMLWSESIPPLSQAKLAMQSIIIIMIGIWLIGIIGTLIFLNMEISRTKYEEMSLLCGGSAMKEIVNYLLKKRKKITGIDFAAIEQYNDHLEFLSKISENEQKTAHERMKGKIALKAWEGQKTIHEIAQEYSVSPSEVIQWKEELQERAENLFVTKSKNEFEDSEDLYTKIGRRTIELESLKKMVMGKEV